MTVSRHPANRRLVSSRSDCGRTVLAGCSGRPQTLEKEARDREGYLRQPQDGDDLNGWEETAAWPDESSRAGLTGAQCPSHVSTHARIRRTCDPSQ